MAGFSIRSSTLRLGIFVSTLIIAAILIFQLVWLKKVYRREQAEFDHGVIKALRGLYEDLNASEYYSSHLNELIENPEPHLYIAQINFPINTDSLVSNLHYELEEFDIFTICYLGVYNADSAKYIYNDVLESAISKAKTNVSLPAYTRKFNHISLYFPNRRQYVIERMDFWIVSSALLLLVLVLFGGSVYYFYRQKFLNETQKDFIHSFTHEFKTPVSVISLAADVLKDPASKDKPEKIATYSGIVHDQAFYMQGQIEKLLRFAYTESGHLHLTRERTNINELIEESVRNLLPRINEKNVELKIANDANDPWLMADRDYIVIVITNLLDNAIKYSKSPKILIVTTNVGNKLILSIKDNGIGIEKKQIGKLFRKFYRVRMGESQGSKGFGIGLAFVKKIIHAHKGKINVVSEPGIGSVFSIELPVK